jgi:hypothetical protein
MKKLSILILAIVIIAFIVLLIQFTAPKTGSIEINLLNPDAPYNPKVNIYLIAGESDSPQSVIIQKVEEVNSPSTITLTDIPPGMYNISSRTIAYGFMRVLPNGNMMPDTCIDIIDKDRGPMKSCTDNSHTRIEVIAGETTKITIKRALLVYS